MAETIREIIQAKSDELRDIESLGPAKAADELVSLSALLSAINKEVVERNYWYNQLCKKVLDEVHVAAKAKITAQASQEWKDWQEGIGYQKATLDIIRSLKYYLRQAEDERRDVKYH